MKSCWRHAWKIKGIEILPSLAEQATAAGANVKNAYDLGHKPCIVTYICARCGAEKVERI